MKKKIVFLYSRFALVAALLMFSALLLTACGGGGGGGGSSSGSTTKNVPFLALSATGTGTFTDASNDAIPNYDYVDITGATVAITSTDITVTITLRNLPATLTFNQASVSLHNVEYYWGVEFDTNNDNLPEYYMQLRHAKDTNTEFTAAILPTAQAGVYKNDSPIVSHEIASATASIVGNTITLTVLKSLSGELSNITSSSKVRITTYSYNSYNTPTPYTDYVE